DFDRHGKVIAGTATFLAFVDNCLKRWGLFCRYLFCPCERIQTIRQRWEPTRAPSPGPTPNGSARRRPRHSGLAPRRLIKPFPQDDRSRAKYILDSYRWAQFLGELQRLESGDDSEPSPWVPLPEGRP